MTNATYTARAISAPAPLAGSQLLGELYAATPLAIFIAAAKAALQQGSKR